MSINTEATSQVHSNTSTGVLMAVLSGLLFGIGLAVSGMINRYRWLRLSNAPWFSTSFSWPTRSDIDAPLIVGAVCFGIGWALSGLCPGPALATTVTAIPGILGFILMMIVGATIARHQQRINALASPSE